MTDLVVDLSDKSPDFILGLEAGKVWNLLSMSLGSEIAGACHEANRHVLMSVAEAKGWRIDYTERDGVWLDFLATRLPEELPKPLLRVVQ